MPERDGHIHRRIPDDCPPKDLEQHFDLLRRKVNDSRSKLPQDCYDPIVIDDMMDVYGIFYAFTGEAIRIRNSTNTPN
mgnify:CR=1 FL=1